MTLVETATDPAPDGAVVDWLTAEDDTRFRVARFGSMDAARGTVVILNGRTEFIEKYFEVIGDLIHRGFAVATLDWRGQGLSTRPLPNPQKGHVEDFDLYVSDLRQAVEQFIDPNCPAPYRALCHSMGGNITLRYLDAYPDTFESAVFSAPMWGIGESAGTRFRLRAVSTLADWIGLGERYAPGGGGDYGDSSRNFEDNVLTHDRGRFERFIAQVEEEPELALGAPTLGWARQAMASIDIVGSPGFAEAIRIPIRVCTAGADGLVSIGTQARIAGRLPNAKQIIVEGAKHELLMELDRHRDRVFAAFDEL